MNLRFRREARTTLDEGGSTDLVALISVLKAKLASATERVTRFGEERRPFALDAVTGDQEAKNAIKKIDVEVATTRNEIETLAVAIAEAEKRKAENDAQVAAVERQRREAEATEICKAILRADQKFDQGAALLQRVLTEREQLVRRLVDLRVVYGGTINALQRRRNINGALFHVGFDKFAKLELVAQDARRPLSELDRPFEKPMFTAIESDPALGGTSQEATGT